MKTSSPFALPVNIVASMMFGISLLTHSLVPLHSLGGSRFLNSSIGEPTFKVKLCGGIPGGSKELRNWNICDFYILSGNIISILRNQMA
jgi:hypothetical protein